jgi:oxalate decarboxylase/phosphoglucose isomerase-like protein (cupin superfamily)
MHRVPAETTTGVFDWGAIKWLVTPDGVSGAQSSFGEVVINPGKGHDRHNHPDADEVLYVIEGTGHQTVGDQEFPLVAGEAVYIPRGVFHSTHNTSWKPLRLIATYTPGGAEKALETLPDYQRLAPGDFPQWVKTTGTGQSS